MFTNEISVKQVDMMKHAWGFASKTPGYRNHYCTQIADPDMKNLVGSGYFEGPYHVGEVGPECGLFYLTTKATNALRGMVISEGVIEKHLKFSGDIYKKLAEEFGVKRGTIKGLLVAYLYRSGSSARISTGDLLTDCREHLRSLGLRTLQEQADVSTSQSSNEAASGGAT